MIYYSRRAQSKLSKEMKPKNERSGVRHTSEDARQGVPQDTKSLL